MNFNKLFSSYITSIPKWHHLSFLHYFSSTTSLPFLPSSVQMLPISNNLKNALISLNIKKLFNCQKYGYHPIFYGYNVLLYSITGSGKTLAVFLPLLQRLEEDKHKNSSSINKTSSSSSIYLFLVPTRELCKQYASFIIKLQPSLRILLIFGNTTVDEKLNRRNIDIIIGTPYRVDEVLQKYDIQNKIKCIIIDEVDEMMSGGWESKINKIIKEIQRIGDIQKIYITACLTKNVKKLIDEEGDQLMIVDAVNSKRGNASKDIKKFDISKKCTSSVKHIICKTSNEFDDRLWIAYYFIKIKLNNKNDKCLLFANSQTEVENIVKHPLIQNKANALHAALTSEERDTAVNSFNEGKVNILVCSDLVSRGLDFKDVKLVLQFHPPMNPIDYIHRSGRSGRGTQQGESLLLYDNTEDKFIKKIEESTNQKFENEGAPSYQEIHSLQTSNLLSNILSVPPEDYEPHLQRANNLLSKNGISTISVGMSILDEKFINLSNSRLRHRSSLTGRRGFSPIKIEAVFCENLNLKQNIFEYLQKSFPSLKPSHVGHIVNTNEGYIVDIISTYVEELISSKGNNYCTAGISPVHQIPKIIHQNKIQNNIQTPWRHQIIKSTEAKTSIFGRRNNSNAIKS